MIRKKDTYKERRREKVRSARKLYTCGKYRYKNISNADVILQIPLEGGRKMIQEKGEFIGGQGYKALCPFPLRLLETIEEVPLDLPTSGEELDELLPLGEKVEIEESVTVEVEDHKDRVELTKELLTELRTEKGLSWSKLASETGYSLTFVRKKCKHFGIV